MVFPTIISWLSGKRNKWLQEEEDNDDDHAEEGKKQIIIIFWKAEATSIIRAEKK